MQFNFLIVFFLNQYFVVSHILYKYYYIYSIFPSGLPNHEKR
jgi:hypothetical protein